jgi:hypothetical protein
VLFMVAEAGFSEGVQNRVYCYNKTNLQPIKIINSNMKLEFYQ